MNFHLSFKNLLRFDSRLMKRNGKSKALCCGDANAGPQPGGGGVRPATHLPKSKVYFYQQLEWAKNGVFVEGLKGVRFKNSTFWVQKVHFYTAPPEINPGYGPVLACKWETNRPILSLFHLKLEE